MDEVLVIGAGPAGLAVGAALAQQGVGGVRILDRAPVAGQSWRNHYERLHLHTHRRFSGLPGLPIPRAFGAWVGRANFVTYLEAYIRRFELVPELGVEVQRISVAGQGFTLQTNRGSRRAKAVVVACGFNHTPWMPEWPGVFSGERLHAADYRTAAPYRGRRVLVAGTGNSGAEIAVDLAEGGADVSLAVRTPPNILRRAVFGIPSQVLAIWLSRLPLAVADAIARLAQRISVPNLSRFGLPRSPRGVFTTVARDRQIPILDMGFIAAVRGGRIRIVPEVAGFDGAAVKCRGGVSVPCEVLIAATGYRRGLESMLEGLPVLDTRGAPLSHGAEPGPVPGLHFVGYRNPITGALRSIAHDARAVARRLAS